MKSNELTAEDLRREAEEIVRKDERLKPKRFPKSMVLIISGIIILLYVLTAIPHFTIKLDPRPKDIPLPSEVIGELTIPSSDRLNTTGRNDGDYYLVRILPVRSEVKLVADKIVSRSCRNTVGDSKVCFSKAIYYFVRDNMIYIGDPPDEYLKTPEESMITFGGDCDDHSILLSSLLSAVGVRTRLVFIPRHVYVQAYLPEAISRYKAEKGDDWVTLDATCDSCEFGETAPNAVNAQKRYLYI